MEQIKPAISVKVDPSDAAPHDFRQEEATGNLIVEERKIDSKRGRDIDKLRKDVGKCR